MAGRTSAGRARDGSAGEHHFIALSRPTARPRRRQPTPLSSCALPGSWTGLGSSDRRPHCPSLARRGTRRRRRSRSLSGAGWSAVRGLVKGARIVRGGGGLTRAFLGRPGLPGSLAGRMPFGRRSGPVGVREAVRADLDARVPARGDGLDLEELDLGHESGHVEQGALAAEERQMDLVAPLKKNEGDGVQLLKFSRGRRGEHDGGKGGRTARRAARRRTQSRRRGSCAKAHARASRVSRPARQEGERET